MYLQLFSVIHIINPEIRAQIAKISTQTYLNGNGELFIFITDLNRAHTVGEKVDQTPTY